jgi:glycosyltransferase involved in cell wall biosynthesis
VLSQNYPNLEYVVVDGASKDESPAIVRKYGDRLAWWVSEPDTGHWDALQKGFAQTSGEIMAWLNSDDKLMPWSLSIVAEIFEAFPEIEWLTSLAQIRWDPRGRAVRCLFQPGFSRAGFLAGENLPRPGAFSTGWIQQESTFWRRSLWDKAGGHFRPEYPLAADFELWARFFGHAELYGVETPLGGFRFHGAQKTGAGHERYWDEGERIIASIGGRRPAPMQQFLRRWAHKTPAGPLRELARRAGWLHPVKICRHHRGSDAWRIIEAWA